MEIISSFKDLDCWKACTDFRRFVRKLIRTFPAEEKFALVSRCEELPEALQITSPKDMEDFILKKTHSFPDKAAVLYMN